MFDRLGFTVVHLDLNLLVALDALLEEGSVGGAAARLHLSAPAMSRTLGRIRTVTGDRILVRTGHTMTPTPFALGVRERVHALVVEAQTVLAPERELDLATLDRTFTVQAHDAVTTAIGPPLLGIVRARAPRVALRLLPEQAVDTLELKHGHLDLEIGSATHGLPEIRTQTLLEDRLVVAMRAGHGLAERTLTARQFAAADHVIVSRRGRLTDPVDDQLDAHGLRRRVLATAPTSTAALHFAAASDLLVVVSERLCRQTVEALGLRTVPVPLDLPPVPLVVAWHERYEHDRAHAWLRSIVAEAVERVAGDASDGGDTA
jgi:DNA-binding transcriptional LysR family regulator